MGAESAPQGVSSAAFDPQIAATGMPLQGASSEPVGIQHDVPGRREPTIEGALRRLVEDIDRAIELQRQGCAVMSQIVLLDASEALSELGRLVSGERRPGIAQWLAARAEVSRRIMASLAFVTTDVAEDCGRVARDLVAAWRHIEAASTSVDRGERPRPTTRRRVEV